MKEEVLFRKTPFGGFDREAVIDYIRQLKETQQSYKTMIADRDNSIKALTEENAELKRRADSAEKSLAELTRKCKDAEDGAKKLRAKNEMLLKQKEKSGSDKDVSRETIERCDKLVESAEAAAEKIKKNAQAQIKKTVKKLEKAKKDPQKAEKILEELVRELS